MRFLKSIQIIFLVGLFSLSISTAYGDYNWPFIWPDDAVQPTNLPATIDTKENDPCNQTGSIIECENQVLRESLGLTGTGLTLNYSSARVLGRKSNTMKIPLSGPQLPASVTAITLDIDIAGRRFGQTFPPQSNLKFTFTWDGLDAFGRKAVGNQTATIRIGYAYNIAYATPERIRASVFGRFGIDPMSIIGVNTASTYQQYTIKLSVFDARTEGLAAWSLSAHHSYDPNGKVLYFGDGSQNQANNQNAIVINKVAGPGDHYYSGDGGPAISAGLTVPNDVAVSPDGSFYISDTFNQRIRRVGLDGIITTVAGNGRAFPLSGDGGPATSAVLSAPKGIALGPDGSLYIADSGNFRIRRVGPDGIITTVAGKDRPVFDSNGQLISNGDGGPATSATLTHPSDVAVGPDGSLYIADENQNRVRRVGLDGIITTVAGKGQRSVVSSGDGGLATLAELNPRGLTVGTDGSLYIVDAGIFVRRVSPDGIITTVAGAGNGHTLASGDGGLATSAGLTVQGVAVSTDGSLYLGDSGNGLVRRVGPDGIISTIAGNGVFGGNSGDGGLPTWAGVTATNVTIGPDGSLFIVDSIHYLIRKISNNFAGFQLADISIPSEDGSELYQFTSTGRHLRTLNAWTGATLFSFSYNPKGLLSTVTDVTGNITAIERDANGNLTGIVAQFGQRTTLSLDANGYLAKATNPAGESYQIAYTNDGLLTAFKDPNGNSSTMSYDTNGRLTKDSNAAGGSQSLARTESANGYQVSLTSALGRSTTHGVTNLLTGDQQRTSRFPDGTQTNTINATNGTHKTTAADGTVTTVTDGPDPRFSMLAPITANASVATGGLTSSLTSTRTTTLSNPADLLSLTKLTDTTTLNGRTSTSVYDAATKTQTTTSAAGRKASSTIDNLGRVVQSQVTGIQATNLSYDTRGRLAAISQGASPNNRDASFSYNPDGYLDTVTDPLGRKASFDYDAAGRITRQTLPDGHEIAYSYDAKGYLTSLTPPGKPGHVFHYTAIDQTDTYEPPVVAGTGNTVYDYDLDKALTKITRPDGQILDFTYDTAGRLSTLTLPTGDINYAYNATTGKLNKITATDGGALVYTYNGALLTRTTWTGTVAGSVDRTYDNDFRVTSLFVNGNNPIAFQYDADSLLTKAGDLTLTRSAQNGLLTGTTLGSLTDSYSYDGFAETTSYEAKYGTSSLLRFEYDYDKLGRITQKRQIKGGITHAFDYSYDIAGRLIEVKRDGVSTASYGYDSNGNRTQLNGALVAHYDDQDRLLDYQGATYQYTANGELKQKTVGGQTTQYDYDVLGNLRKATLPSGTVIDYVIDGQNRRIGKKRNGTLEQGFLYQGQLQPIAELDGSGNIKSRFIYATGVNVPDYLIKGSTTYRIIKDHLGSPRLVVDIATDTIVQELDYDAFGRVIQDTNPGFQPFGFAGGLYDRDTKLVRFGARDYEAESGRWAAKDPILFGGKLVNLYNYSFNDPLNHTDYSGYVPKDKWYGYDKKGPGFKSWYHEQKKNKVYPPNASEEELEDAFEDWVREGRRNPKEKKWKKSKNDENSCNENTETNADSPIPENPESVNSPGDAQARAAVKAAAATAAIAAAGITAAEVGQIILDTLLVLGMFSGG